MNVAQVAAEILKREGVEYLLAYPLNPLTESCAAAGIRPIIVRQERVGIHMADAIGRTDRHFHQHRTLAGDQFVEDGEVRLFGVTHAGEVD